MDAMKVERIVFEPQGLDAAIAAIAKLAKADDNKLAVAQGIALQPRVQQHQDTDAMNQQSEQQSMNQKASTMNQSSKHSDHMKKGLQVAALSTAVALVLFGSSAFAASHGMLPVIDHHSSNVSISTTPSSAAMTITGKGHNALMVWKEYNVGAGASVEYGADKNQPISFLNVVKGPGASYIDGRIKASTDGVNLYFINPNGIHLGQHSKLLNFKSVHLGTSKPTQELMDKFKDMNAPAVDISAMPNSRGMGKVVVMNKIEASDIKINAGHIVIGNIEETFSKTGMPDSISLNSSIDRIDIGGNLDKTHGAKTYREILKDNGYSAAASSDIKASGTLKKNTFVDHSQEVAIYDASQLDRVNADLNGKFWLVDDIKVKDHTPIGKDKGQAFTGSFDGAFNSISYNTQADKAGDHGFFGSLDGATVKNVKFINSSVDTDNRVAGQKLNIGAVAGTINNSKLSNIEVTDFDVLLDNDNPMDKNSTIGALAGSMTGNNTVDNVLVGFNADSEADLVDAQAQGKLSNVGTFAGKHSGTLNKQHIVVGTHANEGSTLKGIGQSDSGSDVAITFAEAANEAIAKGMTMAELLESYAVDGSLDDNSLQLKHKTFLKPFYVEDFNFTYDGNTHDYRDLVNNEGFDIDNLVTKTNGKDYQQHDAGNHVFELTTHDKSKDNGHDYYFSYKYADETWDKAAGGDASLHDRTHRADSITGNATLNINKKKVVVDITDQSILEGTTPNLSINKDTISNYDDLIAHGLANGDKISDLGLSLTVRPDGTIEGSSNSNNYEVEINNGTLTVTHPPKPAPAPLPDAGDHDLSPLPDNDDRLVPKVAKCSHCGDINSYRGTVANSIMPGSSRLLTGDIDYSKSMYAALEDHASPAEFNDYVMAHHAELYDNNDSIDPINGHKSQKLLAKNSKSKSATQAASASSTGRTASVAGRSAAASVRTASAAGRAAVASVRTASAESKANATGKATTLASDTAKSKSPTLAAASSSTKAKAQDQAATSSFKADNTLAAADVSEGKMQTNAKGALSQGRDTYAFSAPNMRKVLHMTDSKADNTLNLASRHNGDSNYMVLALN